MATHHDITPTFGATDYLKFFAAGALAATSTHGVRRDQCPPEKKKDLSFILTTKNRPQHP